MSDALVVVDIGAGNLHSVGQALIRAGAQAPVFTDDPNRIAEAARVVFPGQGAFGTAARSLHPALREALIDRIDRDAPYLGICLGMQLLFDWSQEAGDAHAGLGIFPGQVHALPVHTTPDGQRHKTPHMGWAAIDTSDPLLTQGAYYYFVHSFRCVPDDLNAITARAQFGEVPFCAAVRRGRLFACQFHPEKSHLRGQTLLKRWLEEVPS